MTCISEELLCYITTSCFARDSLTRDKDDVRITCDVGTEQTSRVKFSMGEKEKKDVTFTIHNDSKDNLLILHRCDMLRSVRVFKSPQFKNTVPQDNGGAHGLSRGIGPGENSLAAFKLSVLQ